METAVSDWVTDIVEQLGYAGIGLLMFLENIFPPIPSEVIMPLGGVERWLGPVSSAIIALLLLVYIWRVIRFQPSA